MTYTIEYSDIPGTLAKINDVELDGEADNEVLGYDAATEEWINQTPAEAGIAANPLTENLDGGGYQITNIGNVDGVDISDHNARHEWSGSDEMSIRDLLLTKSVLIGDFQSHDMWSEFVTGSGSVLWRSAQHTEIATGTTQGSYGAFYTAGFIATLSPVTLKYPMFVMGQWGNNTGADCEVRFYAVRGGSTVAPPVDSEVHIGWKVIDGTLFATHCDGTNAEEVTNTGVTWNTAFAAQSLLIIGTTTTIEFYQGQTLRATHSTNLPAPWNYHLYFGILNDGVAADRNMRVRAVNLASNWA